MATIEECQAALERLAGSSATSTRKTATSTPSTGP